MALIPKTAFTDVEPENEQTQPEEENLDLWYILALLYFYHFIIMLIYNVEISIKDFISSF